MRREVVKSVFRCIFCYLFASCNIAGVNCCANRGCPLFASLNYAISSSSFVEGSKELVVGSILACSMAVDNKLLEEDSMALERSMGCCHSIRSL